MPTTAPDAAALAESSRLVVPVMSATGGSGRSTLAGLLASHLAPHGETVVLDTAARPASPWAAWLGETPRGGLASLPPAHPLTRNAARAATAPLPSSPAVPQVLADLRAWSASPLDLPHDPAAWYQLLALGGWQIGVLDTCHPATADLVRARHYRHTSLTGAYYALPYCVPVWTATATSWGVSAVQSLLRAANADGLPLKRTVIAVTAPAEGRVPAAVRAAVTMLRAHVAAVALVPACAHLRAHGLSKPLPSRTRTYAAVRELARAVLAAATGAWGAPLPPAPMPAPLEGPR